MPNRYEMEVFGLLCQSPFKQRFHVHFVCSKKVNESSSGYVNCLEAPDLTTLLNWGLDSYFRDVQCSDTSKEMI